MNSGRAVERTAVCKVASCTYAGGCIDLDVLAARVGAARVHEVIADDIQVARPVLASYVGLAISDYVALDHGTRTAVVDKNAVMGIAAVGRQLFDMNIVVIDIDSASARDVNSVARVCAVVASAGANVRVFNGDVG